MVNNVSHENCMKLKPRSKAIRKACIDFGPNYECAKEKIKNLAGFKNVEICWEDSQLHFLTEEIHPKIATPERPRVMLLFSNPHPDSVRQGLFMSEGKSRGFWDILRSISCLGIKHDFCWDSKESIRKTASLFLNGDYGNRRSPILFFDCLYQIPSRSPKDLKKLLEPNDFDCYLHRQSLDRIGTILDCYDIKTVLVFTIETFESITDKPNIPKGSREILCSLVEERLRTKNKADFWKQMKNNKLVKQVVLPNLKHDCTAIKVMDTFVKYRWKQNDRSVFSWVLEYALEYATEAT